MGQHRHSVALGTDRRSADVVGMMMRQDDGVQIDGLRSARRVEHVEQALLFIGVAGAGIEQVDGLGADEVGVGVRARRQTLAEQRQHAHAGREPDRRQHVRWPVRREWAASTSGKSAMAWPRSNSSSAMVGGDTSISPRVHACSTASALYHSRPVSSPGQMSAFCSGGRMAMKKRRVETQRRERRRHERAGVQQVVGMRP